MLSLLFVVGCTPLGGKLILVLGRVVTLPYNRPRKRSGMLIRACARVRQPLGCALPCKHGNAQLHSNKQVGPCGRSVGSKRRYEPVRIRGRQGELLAPHEEFSEIYQHFAKVFSSDEVFLLPQAPVVQFSQVEVETAISALKGGKAVPGTSVPAEVWNLCTQEYASFFMPHINLNTSTHTAYPPEVTDCTLALLPKPHKPGRRPADLRPLGLQDPGSKVLATAVRAKLQEVSLEYLRGHPQYAYCPNRAIDEAIGRVTRHCSEVRERVKTAEQSVHDRRAGKQRSTCIGGIMLGVDLSRAFDCVTRAALQRALQHAGAPAPLQQAVPALHAQCRYTVKHRGSSDSFSMQCGVRQGCTLSPYLFALLTCLIYDVVAERTSTAWAAAAMTLFADDTHLAWDIRTTQDLSFFLHSVRVTFAVFAEFGLTINPEKSQLVVRLRGSAAAPSRKHKDVGPAGSVLNVGTPHKPIRIPLVPRMTYLGIVASYGPYEMQTCLHRQKAALANRQRVAKVLHHRLLTVQQRVRLYVACVRSCLLYGQHAVGFSHGVLRKHDQFDSRVLRAIARAPAHITHETTAALRERRHVDSPGAVLQKTLQRRVAKVLCPEVRARFERLASDLHVLSQLSETQGTTKLTPLSTSTGSTIGVPCPDCGLYFPSVQVMRTHRAKRHGYVGQNARRSSGVVEASRYAQGSIGGMPQCASCGRIFTLVEALKKHLSSGCLRERPAATVPEGFAPNSAVSECATVSVEQVPAERKRLPKGGTPEADSECRSVPLPPPAMPIDVPPITQIYALFDNPIFVEQVRSDWRQAVRRSDFNRILREHCLLCGQWGERLKQHVRRMHPIAWQRRPDAEAQCRSLGLIATNPCSYCGASVRQPGAHLRNCIAVFQASLANVLLRSGVDGSADGRSGQGTGPASATGPGGGMGRAHVGEGQGQGARERDGGERSPDEVEKTKP